jgi:hypothetical protein
MSILSIIITIVILVGAFILFRQVNLWYFRINEGLTLMQQQNELLIEIRDSLAKPSQKTDQVLTCRKVKFDGDEYVLKSGARYKIYKEDFDSNKSAFCFTHAGKQYFYLTLESAKQSLNEIGMGNPPSKTNLILTK